MADEWYVKGLRNIVQETIKESRLPHDTQNPVLLRKLGPLLAEGDHAAFERHVSWGATGNMLCWAHTFELCKNPPCQMYRAARKAFLEGCDGK